MGEPESQPRRPVGILLSRDLIFTSKVTGTARELGQQVLTAGNSALASAMIAEWQPKVVFLDLAAGDLASVPAIVAYRNLAGAQTAFVAFGSHVDTASLDAARDAGCDEVLARSQFSAQLPQIIERYLRDANENPQSQERT
jgi:hypothetical protein